MRIYPTLELMNGLCVSLRQGRTDEAEVWHIDPLATARAWAAAGAEWVHLTNFDWLDGSDGSDALTLELLRGVGLPVQLAGGFLTADGVADWIDKGAARIVVETLAARDPQTVLALAKSYPDQIVLSVDIKAGRVMTDGWRQESAWEPQAFLKEFAEAPLAAVIVTDIDEDGSETDAQLGVVSSMAEIARAPVIANGVVRKLDDVARLKYVANIDGALVGRALMRKTFTIEEALEVARPEPEPVAEFI